jgi:hypothetical protein
MRCCERGERDAGQEIAQAPPMTRPCRITDLRRFFTFAFNPPLPLFLYKHNNYIFSEARAPFHSVKMFSLALSVQIFLYNYETILIRRVLGSLFVFFVHCWKAVQIFRIYYPFVESFAPSSIGFDTSYPPFIMHVRPLSYHRRS